MYKRLTGLNRYFLLPIQTT